MELLTPDKIDLLENNPEHIYTLSILVLSN